MMRRARRARRNWRRINRGLGEGRFAAGICRVFWRGVCERKDGYAWTVWPLFNTWRCACFVLDVQLILMYTKWIYGNLYNFHLDPTIMKSRDILPGVYSVQERSTHTRTKYSVLRTYSVSHSLTEGGGGNAGPTQRLVIDNARQAAPAR